MKQTDLPLQARETGTSGRWKLQPNRTTPGATSRVFSVRLLNWRLALAVALTTFAQPAIAQSIREYHRTLAVAISDPVTLDVHLSDGELQIAYGRNEQVWITASAQVPVGAKADEQSLGTVLAVEQNRNQVQIRNQSNARRTTMKIRIDVPYWTEVRSIVDNGDQTITGIMGPVKAEASGGDIKVSYVSKGVAAAASAGNLNLEVISGRITARTGTGNITCIRAAQGASVEVENGNIVLLVVGPSEASVTKGPGKIEVGGARGSFRASTTEGEIHVKAVPRGDWRLNSASGNIRIELPPAAAFDVDAMTDTGRIQIDRNDIERPPVEVRHLSQKVNGGGQRIEARTGSGKIVIR